MGKRSYTTFFAAVALQRLVSTHRISLHASILSVHVWHHAALLRIHLQNPPLTVCVHVWCPPTLMAPYHRAKATGGGGLLQRLWEREKKFERRRKRKRWVMNYRADHFRLGPGRGRGSERERDHERERDSPSILPCPVWYVGSHWGEQFMANWSGSNISRKATSGSIATILAGHINPLLYVVLSVQ